MSQILSGIQAAAIAQSVAGLAAVGARPGRISLGQGIHIRCRGGGEIIVMKVGEEGKISAKRTYSSLAYFISEHQGAA